MIPPLLRRLATGFAFAALALGVCAPRRSSAEPATAAPPPAPQPAKGRLVLSGTEGSLRFFERGGVVFFCLPDLGPALRGNLTADEPGAIFSWRQGERTLHFTIEAPVATFDDEVVSLPAAPVVAEGGPYLPADFVVRQLVAAAGLAAEWKGSEKALFLRPAAGAEIPLTVSIAAVGEVTKCVFGFPSPVRYEVEKKPESVVLQFQVAGLVPPFADQDSTDPIVSRISFRNRSATVLLRRGSWATEVYSLQNPFRVVVELQRVARELAGIRIGRAAEPSAAAKPAFRTVVVDPGHGGVEVGAKGKLGSLEKDLTLDLAKALQSVLESKGGYRVLLTREKDVQVPLEDRPAFANHQKADLFVSIHLNASPAKKIRGSETYYLSLSATDEAARHLAEQENIGSVTAPPPTSGGSTEDLDFLLWDLVQNEHVKESALLAEDIQIELDAMLGMPNRGIKQAPFRVLIGAAMPAVLVEASFLSNPEEEKSLLSPEFRRRVAEAIATGIEAFRSRGAPRELRDHEVPAP
jgi:N-acetylmuramoyl-L-alanine amidase